MVMRFLESLLKIEFQGVACLLANIVGLCLILKAGENYPVDPSIVVHNRRSLWFAKITVGFSMMFASQMPLIDMPILSELLHALRILGPLYFPASLILDALAYVALHAKEWCSQDLAIALNFVNIPLVTLVVGCYVYAQSKKMSVKIEASSINGLVLGHVTMTVRRVTSVKIPETYLGTNIVLQNEKWEVRKVPKQTPYIYDPESRSNLHICITGSSGVGKTTATIYIVSELLKKEYPVIVFDPKGDISMTAMARGWCEEKDERMKKVLVLDVGSLGVDPLQPISDEPFMERVSDLINAMSVVEEVGANQKYLIIRSAGEVEKKKKTSYRALLNKVRKYVDSLMEASSEPPPRYGPYVRDAYMGIRSKMEILSTVFKEDSRLNISILNPEKWSQKIAGVIVDLSKIRDRYARAVTMELLLRKLEQMLRKRGPLSFLLKKKVFIVVDEAHELARSQRWRQDITVSILEDMAREARSHGAGLIIITQRLADIPDGIRMNMGLWLSLKTDSPQDIQILRTVMPVGRLPEIVTSMAEGCALVVEAMPQRLEKMQSISSKPIAVEEAYIVKLERKMAEIKGSVEKAVQSLREVAEKVGRDAEKIMEEIALKNGVEFNSKIDEGGESDTPEDNLIGESDLDDSVSYVVEKVCSHLKDEKKGLLKKIPRRVVEEFIENIDVKPSELPYGLQQLFLKHGLLCNKNGRIVETLVGRLLKKAFKEVEENGRRRARNR